MTDLKHLLLVEKGQKQMRFIKVPFIYRKTDTQTKSLQIL